MLRELTLFSVLLCSSLAQDPAFTVRFDGFLQLSRSPLYELYWTVTGDRITFAVRAETSGWVGLGISPDGGMPNSDVIMGFVDDSTGAVAFTDRRTSGRSQPAIDAQQDWSLIAGEQDGSLTTLEFTRLLDTGDATGDSVIGERVNLIWSLRSDDNTNSFHNSAEGARLRVGLLPPPTTPPTTVAPATQPTTQPTTAATTTQPTTSTRAAPETTTQPTTSATDSPTLATNPISPAATTPMSTEQPVTNVTISQGNSTEPATGTTASPITTVQPTTGATTASPVTTVQPTKGATTASPVTTLKPLRTTTTTSTSSSSFICPRMGGILMCTISQSFTGVPCRWSRGKCRAACCQPKKSRYRHYSSQCSKLSEDSCDRGRFCNWEC